MAEKKLREKIKGILKIPRSFAGTVPYEDWITDLIHNAYEEAGYVQLAKDQSLPEPREVYAKGYGDTSQSPTSNR